MHVLRGGMQSLERGMVADMPPPNKRISTSRRDILGLSGYVLLQKTWLHSASHLVKKYMVFLYCVHVPENGDSDEPGATPNKKSDTSLPVGKQNLLCRNSLCWGLAGHCHLSGRKEAHGDLKQGLKSCDTKPPNWGSPHGRPLTVVTGLVKLNSGGALSLQHVNLIHSDSNS